MKPKPSKRIDKLLGELGLHFSKVARYRRERMPKGCERTAQAQPASRSLASSFLHPMTFSSWERSWSSSEKEATKTFRKTARREFMTGYCSGTLMSHRSSF
jgi:hypothetical protein